MKTKVTMIFFTYKRALQLDAAIESLLINFENLQLPIHVIYHWSKDHEISYEKLKRKWGSKKVTFHRRKKLGSKCNMVKLLYRPLNLYWFIKIPWLRKSFDNFKYLLEDVIANSKSEFIVFSTDDQICYNKTEIPESAFELIKSSPKNFSYRFTTSLNFGDENMIPKDLEVKIHQEKGKPIFFQWDNKNNFKNILWKYRFHVDGTVFEKKAILALLKPMLYHMPTTLEGGGLWEARIRGFYRHGLSAIKRTSIGVQANNIQTISDTPCAYFDPELLRQAYEDGYHMVFDKSRVNEKDYIFIPTELTLQHDITKEVITYTKYVKKQ